MRHRLALAATASLWITPAIAQVTTVDGADVDTGDSDIFVYGKSTGSPEVGKTLTPRKDLPNTISVIEREQFEAQNLQTVEDVLTATPGITVTGVGSEGADYISRGFTINNFLLDGVPTLAFAFPNATRDLFFYDRVEVLRGPAGLFSGSGNPAGSINLVRKRPLPVPALQASVGYGSWDNLRVELDGSARAGAVGLRVGLMVQDQDQFFDIAHRNRLQMFAIGDVAITDDTTITVGAYYDRFKPAIQTGLPGIIGGLDGSEGQLLDVDRSTYLGADWNRFRSDTYTAFAEVQQRLGNRWTLKASGLYNKVDRIDVYSYIGNQPVTATNGLTNQIAYRGDSFNDAWSADINLIGGFDLFGREQTLVVGGDYINSDDEQFYTRLSNFARIDVYNPVSPAEPPLNPYGPSPAFPGPNGPVTQAWGGTSGKVEQFGTYGQLRLSPVEGLTLVGGGRFTWWENITQALLPTLRPEVTNEVNGRFTPYAGLVWDVSDQLNVYLNYADSFTPQAAPSGRTRPDGEAIDSLIGEQFELGSKLGLFGDRLLLSGAVYQIKQKNRLFNDPDDQTVVLQIGEVRSRGVELEASGQVMPGWFVNGGYSYTKTKYLEDATYEGLPLVPVVPKHQVKLFTNYKPEGGPLAGFSVGGGLTYFSDTYGGNPATVNAAGNLVRSTIVRQGSYIVADLRAGYAFNDRYSLSVNVANLFDENYYARIASTGRGNFYGAPRSVFATLKVRWP